MDIDALIGIPQNIAAGLQSGSRIGEDRKFFEFLFEFLKQLAAADGSPLAGGATGAGRCGGGGCSGGGSSGNSCGGGGSRGCGCGCGQTLARNLQFA